MFALQLVAMAVVLPTMALLASFVTVVAMIVASLVAVVLIKHVMLVVLIQQESVIRLIVIQVGIQRPFVFILRISVNLNTLRRRVCRDSSVVGRTLIAGIVHVDVDCRDDVAALFSGARLVVITGDQASPEYNYGPVADVEGIDDGIIADQFEYLAYVQEQLYCMAKTTESVGAEFQGKR